MHNRGDNFLIQYCIIVGCCSGSPTSYPVIDLSLLHVYGPIFEPSSLISAYRKQNVCGVTEFVYRNLYTDLLGVLQIILIGGSHATRAKGGAKAVIFVVAFGVLLKLV